ncbi:aldose 1-epimerase family protein [Rhizobium sp. P38BS-XIX]|nr:aldose 1-epimerase family protein [Rhizobium sp. P38BS-XIX]
MTTDIRRRTPDLRGLADIRLVTLEDGPGRGQRLLVARNAAGLCFEVAVDRGFDLSQLSFRGTSIGFHSPNQSRFPAIEPSAEDGWAFLRNFDGFLVTCGLDHFGAPATADISSLNHPHLKSVRRPLHGRIASEQARLAGYGVDDENAFVWCEGIVRQAGVFGETLELRRRFTAPIFGSTVEIADTITNLGFRPTDHAILYHINFGYPFLDEATKVEGLPADFAGRFHEIDRRPADDFGEMVDILKSDALPSTTGLTIVNEMLGLKATLRYSSAELPSLFIWRAYQSGLFALGIEPAFDGADAQGRAQILAPGESRKYGLQVSLSETRA